MLWRSQAVTFFPSNKEFGEFSPTRNSRQLSNYVYACDNFMSRPPSKCRPAWSVCAYDSCLKLPIRPPDSNKRTLVFKCQTHGCLVWFPSRRQVRGLEFDPFCPNNLATGGGDGMVKVWSIPQEGLKEDLISPLVAINTGEPGSSLS